jgi:hypothetical protein
VVAHVSLNAITQGGEFIFAPPTRPVRRAGCEAAANRSRHANLTGDTLKILNWRDALVAVRPETMIRWHRRRLETVLAPEVPAWPTADSPTITGSDPPHGEREPFVGRGTHCQ